MLSFWESEGIGKGGHMGTVLLNGRFQSYHLDFLANGNPR